jgi:hypothetical protein
MVKTRTYRTCNVKGCRGKAMRTLLFWLHPCMEWLACDVAFCLKHSPPLQKRGGTRE